MTTYWRGVLAPLDTPSSDGRTLVSPLIGAMFHDPTPLSVFQVGGPRVGWIRRLWIENKNIMAEGDLSSLTEPLDQGWFTGGLDVTGGDWDYSSLDDLGRGESFCSGWKITSFHIHTNPAFTQTRLDYV